MSYRNEMNKAYKEHFEKTKELYNKYKGAYIAGQLDGEPWMAEERALKNELLKKIAMIKKKYNEI